MEPLNFEVIKTKEVFLKNYSLHDKACSVGDSWLIRNGFEVKEFGKDRRYQRVWEKGRDKYDRIVVKKQKDIAFLDWKGHREESFMINQRAYNSYLQYMKKYKLPGFVAIIIVPKEVGYYLRLPAPHTTPQFMHHDYNWIVKFRKEDMKPLTNLIAELNNLYQKSIYTLRKIYL